AAPLPHELAGRREGVSRSRRERVERLWLARGPEARRPTSRSLLESFAPRGESSTHRACPLSPLRERGFLFGWVFFERVDVARIVHIYDGARRPWRRAALTRSWRYPLKWAA